jgi:hypothetical protein
VVTRVRDYWPYNTSKGIRIWIITEVELPRITDIGRRRIRKPLLKE